MNAFFYNLGKRTANVVDGTISGTGSAGHAVLDAVVSYKRGLQEQTIANKLPSTKGYDVTELVSA